MTLSWPLRVLVQSELPSDYSSAFNGEGNRRKVYPPQGVADERWYCRCLPLYPWTIEGAFPFPVWLVWSPQFSLAHEILPPCSLWGSANDWRTFISNFPRHSGVSRLVHVVSLVLPTHHMGIVSIPGLKGNGSVTGPPYSSFSLAIFTLSC